MGPSPHLWFLHAKQRLLDPNNKSLWSQRSPVVLCMKYSVISTRITCLYKSQPLSEVYAGKTAPFGPEQQVSMGPRHPLSLCACKTARFAPELQVSVGPRPHLLFCACKTACRASEILVSMGPRSHLWILIAKTASFGTDL